MDTVKEQLVKDVARLKEQVADLREKLAKATHTHAAPAEAPPVPAPSTKRGWGGKK